MMPRSLFDRNATVRVLLDQWHQVEEALNHPYLASMHDETDEPICPVSFNFEFEEHALTTEQMRELIYREALAFNPS